MVWVGGKKQISLSRFSPVAFTALSTSFVTSAYSALTQCVDTLNDSTDLLARIFFAQSNGCIQLLEFRITNYSDHVLYHFCTIFRHHLPVPHSGDCHLTFGSLPAGKSLGGSCVSPRHLQYASAAAAAAAACMPVHACRFMQAGSSSMHAAAAAACMHALKLDPQIMHARHASCILPLAYVRNL
jgi:hypothetical protein